MQSSLKSFAIGAVVGAAFESMDQRPPSIEHAVLYDGVVPGVIMGGATTLLNKYASQYSWKDAAQAGASWGAGLAVGGIAVSLGRYFIR